MDSKSYAIRIYFGMMSFLVSETNNQAVHVLEAQPNNLYAGLLCKVPDTLSDMKAFLVAKLV